VADSVLQVLKVNADLLVSLLLPSVRIFISSEAIFRTALTVACALRQAGYKHIWEARSHGLHWSRDISPVIAPCTIVTDRTSGEKCIGRWITLLYDSLPDLDD
jgi:hypothetical protein